MASAMFHYAQAMTDLVLAACRDRLSMDPVALDFGGLVESLDAELAGLMRPEGNDAAHNTAESNIANLPGPDAGNYLELSVHPSGSISVTNPRTGNTVDYPAK